jgi:hypothetical protein
VGRRAVGINAPSRPWRRGGAEMPLLILQRSGGSSWASSSRVAGLRSFASASHDGFNLLGDRIRVFQAVKQLVAFLWRPSTARSVVPPDH